jgi:YVTN family beta-propeller protein
VTSDYRVDGAAEDTVVVRIDTHTNRAVETIAVGGHPIDIAAAGGAVWVRWPIPAGCCGSPGR